MNHFDPSVRITTTERLEFLDAQGNLHAVVGADIIDGLRKFFTEENDEWVATLESLLADVYTILKPLAEDSTHGSYSPILLAYSLLNAQDFTKREAGAS